MWRATVGYDVKETSKNGDGDDWETDPDFINDVTEEEQRWGSKTVEGSGRTAAAINIHQLRNEVARDDAEIKKKILESGPKASYGYGGKFGLQQDRMDKSAVGHDYIAQVEKHASQVDAVKGFGGKYGVQSDRQDKSAVGWDHHEEVDKHASQKDYSSGFGGQYGVQTDRVDRTAVGWEYHEKTEKHPSQKDYSKGFGGKYGVQEDRKDKSAFGWDSVTKVEAHPSQTDMKHGFGGKFGVETDRQDKSAHTFQDVERSQEKPKSEPVVSAGKASSLKSRFENMAKVEEEEARKRAEEERSRRIQRENKEKEAAKKDEEERQRKLSLREESGVVEEHREPASNPVRKTVAVPTPLVQATTAKNASPDSGSFHRGTTALTQPPTQFEDAQAHEFDHKGPSSSPQETFLEPVMEEMADSELFRPPQSYSEPAYETLEDVQEELSEESGLLAVALYDYQAADSDEISFDPDDIITNIEMIDEGWWRGECHGQIGLFPANYVQLLQQ